jgi:hypothetical protein
MNFKHIFNSEVIGVWVISPDKISTPTLVVKIPTTTTKALRANCKVELYLGLTGHQLGIGLLIYDSLDSPLLIPMAARSLLEINGCRQLLDNKTLDVSIYDEFNAMIMSGKAEMVNKDPSAITKACLDNVTLPNNPSDVEETICSICHAINPDYGTTLYRPVALSMFSLALELNPIMVITADETELFVYDVDDQNEGETQEKQLYQQLKLYFEQQVYLSPKVQVGKDLRELIDVMVIVDNTTLLFESKALCINDSKGDSSNDKKARKVTKHCRKALKQIEGAGKNFRNPERILSDSKGVKIEQETIENIIGIIVISEFIPHSEWEQIVGDLLNTSQNNRMPIVVLDLFELVKTLRICFATEKKFYQLLIQRYLHSKKHQTLQIECTDSSLPF